MIEYSVLGHYFGGFMSGTLTKADIISAIQTEHGYSLNKSIDIVETLLEIIKSTLASGEDVIDQWVWQIQYCG